jgi:broad specificity phosphatase PhoE
MTLQLGLIAQGATAATQAAAFPGDEPLRDGLSEAGVLPPSLRRWRGAELRLSPRLAARQTAAGLGLGAADPEAGLADLDCGRWSGRALAEVAAAEPAALAAWLADPAFAGHGGESRAALAARAAGWLDALTPHRGRVLAVTHAAVIRSLVLHVLQAPAPAFWCLDLAPFSFTELSHDGRRWALRGLGLPLRAED